MTVVTVDNTDFPAILAEAGVEQVEASAGALGGSEASRDETPPEVKAEAKPESKPEVDDEEEDENGLTAAERQGLTEKMQRAIGKKHRAMREAEEFAAAQYNTAQLAQRRAQELEAEVAKLQGAKPQPEAPKAPEKPQRQDYATESEFLDATIQWGVEQELAKRQAQQAKEEAERRQQELIQAATQRIEKARELVPDFDEVCSKVDAEVPPVVAGYMQKSEMFAELGYYLAKNPEVLVSLGKLPPDEQLVKIGKIEDKLQPFAAQGESKPNGKPESAPSEPTVTPPSKARGSAAPVITPLGDAGSAGVQKDPADMNIRETIQHWARTNGANLNARKRH